MTKQLLPSQIKWLQDNNKTYPVLCKICTNPVKWRHGTKGGQFNTYCSRDCAKRDSQSLIDKRNNTILEKYGVSHQMHIPGVKNKRTTTMLERHGVEYSGQSNLLIEKGNQTKLERYGNTSYNNAERRKQTMLERYNVEYTAQSEELKQKMRQTSLEKYGVEYIHQLDYMKEQVKRTCLEKYGTESYTQTDDFKEKSKKTLQEKYGVTNIKQKHMVDILPLITDYNWLYDQYITQNKTATQIAEELGVGNTVIGTYLTRHEIEIKQHYQYSYKCIVWLESIVAEEGIYIQHALNGGEYNIPGTRYKADGYCAETNTIYEFHGDYWHGNPNVYSPDIINESTDCTMGELYQRTVDREQQIKEMGYNLITTWEQNFMRTN